MQLILFVFRHAEHYTSMVPDVDTGLLFVVTTIVDTVYEFVCATE